MFFPIIFRIFHGQNQPIRPLNVHFRCTNLQNPIHRDKITKRYGDGPNAFIFREEIKEKISNRSFINSNNRIKPIKINNPLIKI